MGTDGLASWNDGEAKHAILSFVARVTAPGTEEFVPPAERVAVFDNDGTLWCEKPLPVQADFLLRQVSEQAIGDASLRRRQPWKAVVEKDYAWLGGAITKHYQGDDGDLHEMAGGLLQAYAGATIEDFEAAAEAFVQAAQHPRLGRRYRDCAYRPMIELLRLLEEHGFTNYIATGGGRDFMRPVSEGIYGIPPERVIGSSVALEYRDSGPVATLVHKPALDVFDDGVAKPLQIWSRVGRRPLLGVGNANGDIEMLHFCAHPSRPSLALLVDHDDPEREYAYREGAEQALERAREDSWTVISLREDWKSIFVQ